MSDLSTRFDGICERLADALARSGRPGGAVQLVAVSKLHAAEDVAGLARHWAGSPSALAAAGQPVFGENYMQEAREKMIRVAELLSGLQTALRWHFVGHVQSRKARDIAGHFALIHSVDSVKLGAALQKAWQTRVVGGPRDLDAPAPEPQAVLVQVNVGREAQKSGVAPEELEPLLLGLSAMPGLALRGLMCLPPLSEIGERSRPYFVMLRELGDAMRARTGLALPELSMGMSDDFEAAIEEGATLVRIGTDIFGPRR